MLTFDELERRGDEIAASPDLAALLARLAARAEPLLARTPPVPRDKALLSADGGVCPDDGAPLRFDPWSAREHACPACGRIHRGERHDRAWARHQHLWLAERTAHLAAVGILAGDERMTGAARGLLTDAATRYGDYPNRDNVLGPSRLFFSTYLESVWLTSQLAAATLLREAGLLDEEAITAVDAMADDAAGLIGEFDEGFSNRQTWNDAALAAVAAWFEDEELARRAIESETGLLAHLTRGFGPDGMWYEGENYHLFALRGLLTGLGWARLAGVDPAADPAAAALLEAALLAPARSALPDCTFPARKDARFGVSLAQPMYLELWEVGLARLRSGAGGGTAVADWLAALYALDAPPAETFDAYLHEAGEDAPCGPRSRADLSWWALLELVPELGGDPQRWHPDSALLPAQGVALLRTGGRYAALECGRYGGGHGHPDRLHLTLYDGAHWLPDFGTGSYVAPDLFWYRSTLAHNAPRLDGRSQSADDAACEAFDVAGDWAWVRGRFGELSRVLVSGPDYLLDVVELSAPDQRLLELPWHLQGSVELETPGRWEPAGLDDRFAHDAERFVPDRPGALRVRVTGPGGVLSLAMAGDGELLRAVAPGPPGRGEQQFLLRRARAAYARFVTVLSRGAAPEPAISGEAIELPAVGHLHRPVPSGWSIAAGTGEIALAGLRPPERPYRPLLALEPPPRMEAAARFAPELPSLADAGELLESPVLVLDHEDQYRRSEEPWPGPETFSAHAWVGWNREGLLLAVDVRRAAPRFRSAGDPPLRLDNEPDLIHGDGLQLHASPAPGVVLGWLVVPDPAGDALQVRPVGGTLADAAGVEGRWGPTADGYRVVLGLRAPALRDLPPGAEVGFDLLVNTVDPDRIRRSGQLVWSGGGGWVYLRGDRQDPERFGRLRLEL